MGSGLGFRSEVSAGHPGGDVEQADGLDIGTEKSGLET